MTDTTLPKQDRHWLVYRRSIETPVRRGAAGKAISEYLESIGFQQTQLSPTMRFERGSNLASLYNPNPKSQRTELSVDFASVDEQTIVEVTMRVNCFGNRPLSKDFDFWHTELVGIEDVLEHGYVSPMSSQHAAERAMWYSITIMLSVLLIVLVLLFVGVVGIVLLA